MNGLEFPADAKKTLKHFSFLSLPLSLRFVGHLMQPKNIKSHIFQMLGFLVVYEWLCPVIHTQTHTQRQTERLGLRVWHRYALGIHLLQDNSPGQSHVIIFFFSLWNANRLEEIARWKTQVYVLLSFLGSLASFRLPWLCRSLGLFNLCHTWTMNTFSLLSFIFLCCSGYVVRLQRDPVHK